MSFKESIEDLALEIKNGGIGIIPTDTIYGMVGSALNEKVVERMYSLRERDKSKPFTVLVSSIKDIEIFNSDLPNDLKNFLEKIWPNPVSVIIKVENPDFEYLTRGTKTIAFRVPDKKDLIDLLSKTGPLIAPSANPQGEKPAETMDEAWEYFPELDFYIDGGKLNNVPSTLISIDEGKVKVLREGLFEIPENLK